MLSCLHAYAANQAIHNSLNSYPLHVYPGQCLANILSAPYALAKRSEIREIRTYWMMLGIDSDTLRLSGEDGYPTRAFVSVCVCKCVW